MKNIHKRRAFGTRGKDSIPPPSRLKRVFIEPEREFVWTSLWSFAIERRYGLLIVGMSLWTVSILGYVALVLQAGP